MARLAYLEEEELFVQSALQRIERAKSRGKSDVKLSQEQLMALERRKKRMEKEEAERRKKRESGPGSDRKKRKEIKVAVPVAQFESIPRKQRTGRDQRSTERSSSRRPLGEDLPDGLYRPGYPPVGWFPPPPAPRSRPRAETSVSQRLPNRMPDRQESSPIGREHGPRHSTLVNSRYASGSLDRSRGQNLSSSALDRYRMDPFYFRTEAVNGPPFPPGSSRRHASGPETGYPSRHDSLAFTGSPMGRSQHRFRQPTPDDETSEEDSETSEESISDGLGNGVKVREQSRSRAPRAIPEVSPERTRTPIKKKPVPGSLDLRRKTASSDKGGRKKKK